MAKPSPREQLELRYERFLREPTVAVIERYAVPSSPTPLRFRESLVILEMVRLECGHVQGAWSAGLRPRVRCVQCFESVNG